MVLHLTFGFWFGSLNNYSMTCLIADCVWRPILQCWICRHRCHRESGSICKIALWSYPLDDIDCVYSFQNRILTWIRIPWRRWGISLLKARSPCHEKDTLVSILTVTKILVRSTGHGVSIYDIIYPSFISLANITSSLEQFSCPRRGESYVSMPLLLVHDALQVFYASTQKELH